MHAVHTTPGFVIDSRPYGEAGKILSLFTRDFGLVSAIAQGIRLEKSKLRYHSQDLSFGNYSLVRGKEFWRLTSAQENMQERVRSEIMARVGMLLKRFLQGEDPHPELFHRIESLAGFIANERDLTFLELKALESLAVFQILRDLGYIGDDSELTSFVNSRGMSRPILEEALSKRVLLNQHINKALKESHL